MAEPRLDLSPPAPQEPAGSDDIFRVYAGEEHDDKRSFRTSLLVAVAVHTVLLALTIPQIYSQPAPEPPVKKKVFVVQPLKFKERKPEPVRPPERREMRVPMPDPTPDDPEPLRVDEPEPVVELPPLDTAYFTIPDRPPEPEVTLAKAGIDVGTPVRVKFVAPRYTEIARKVRLEGVVILQAIIDQQGDVRDVKVLKGLSMGLTETAVEAVQQWKYQPSTLRGKPVAVMFNLTVHFELQ